MTRDKTVSNATYLPLPFDDNGGRIGYDYESYREFSLSEDNGFAVAFGLYNSEEDKIVEI